jgi:hypothetical protein
MVICMFVPKVWNHFLDATYCEFSFSTAKEKYKSIRDSTLYSHVGLYYAPLWKLKIDAHCGATKMIRQRRASHACPTMTQDELKIWSLSHLRFDMLPSDGARFRKNVSMRFENPLDASFSFVHVLSRNYFMEVSSGGWTTTSFPSDWMEPYTWNMDGCACRNKVNKWKWQNGQTHVARRIKKMCWTTTCLEAVVQDFQEFLVQDSIAPQQRIEFLFTLNLSAWEKSRQVSNPKSVKWPQTHGFSPPGSAVSNIRGRDPTLPLAKRLSPKEISTQVPCYCHCHHDPDQIQPSLRALSEGSSRRLCWWPHGPCRPWTSRRRRRRWLGGCIGWE